MRGGRQAVDMVGQVIGRLTVLERVEPPNKFMCHGYTTQAWWLCKCECGGMKIAPRRNLIYGNTASCGCLRADNIVTARSFRHRKST